MYDTCDTNGRCCRADTLFTWYVRGAPALALLSSQGGERHYKPGEVRKAREGKDGDNTLEVVTLVRVSPSL